MRKVKCGIEKCGNECGMVGKMRNAEKVKWEVNLPIIQYLDQLNVNMTDIGLGDRAKYRPTVHLVLELLQT